MSLIHIDHVPETVKVNLPLNIIVPDTTKIVDIPLSKRKVLYLLHGLGDDASAWQRYSTIETIAAVYGLVVVMPSSGRSFYADLPNGQKYFTYLTEELPVYLNAVFGILPSRKDTLIAGNSMGGYGAVKAALLHPELYGSAASFSGFLSFEFLKSYPDDPRRAEFSTIFGDLENLPGSEHDPAVWIKNASFHPNDFPRLFIACGRQEDLHPLSGLFFSACKSAGLTAEYFEEDGHHDWLLWDGQIKRFLARELNTEIKDE